jgi:hypothetical protein
MNNANDTLVELYKAQLDRFNQRRIYEWRVALTFWTGIVVATGFLAGKYQASTGDGVYFILLWIFYGYWIWNIWAANNYDKRWAEFYRNKIHESLSLPQNGQTAIPGRSDRLGFLKDWSFWSQMIFTAILLLTSWYVLQLNPSLGQ